MKKTTRVLARACYCLFGAGYLAVGGIALLFGTGLVPRAFRDALADESRGDLNTLHILQEFGALLVFAGLITFWFVRHYEQSRAFHWSMTAFWGLMALIHWFNVAGPWDSVVGPLINTVPVVLFLVIGILREATEGAAATRAPVLAAREEQVASVS